MEALAENAPLFVAVAALLGLIVVFIFGLSSAPGSQQNRELERQLEDAKIAQERLQARVEEHFAGSAQKLDALTQQYKEVYTHIAEGAAELCPGSDTPRFEALGAPEAADENPVLEADDLVVEPPRDYAPKSSPDDPGVLNERCGLETTDMPPAENPEKESTS